MIWLEKSFTKKRVERQEKQP